MKGTESPAPPSIDPNLHPDICRDLIRSSAVKCDQILRGSNYTFLVELTLDGKPFEYGVYKPQRGENPLWDFPIGTLYKREVAAYVLSEALGWHFVPPNRHLGRPLRRRVPCSSSSVTPTQPTISSFATPILNR